MGDISKNFNRSEFACRCGCGFDVVDVELIETLELIRVINNGVIKINSGCRCQKHNNVIGGGSKSQHLLGKAADVSFENVNEFYMYNRLISVYKNKYGIGLYLNFIHIDVRPEKARWGIHHG